MDVGLLALIGVFAVAAACAVWNLGVRRSSQRRLADLGFEPCHAHAPALAETWRALASACGRPREIQVTRCWRRAGGWGLVHALEVCDRTHARERGDATPVLGARFDAYLIDVHGHDSQEADAEEGAARSGPAVTLYLARPGASLIRALLGRVIALDPPGEPLEITSQHAWAACLLAAYGAAPGKLDACMPAALQEKLARAAEHGFFAVHLAGGQLGLAAVPGRRDVDAEWRYVSEWI